MALVTLLFFAAAPAPAAAEQEELVFDQRHVQWLDEVSYIITKQERDAFLTLTDSRSRDQFIDIFWRARDPTPGTALNEYREEHYRRWQYANQYLGRDSPSPGWKTDRGRIYIQLGKPRSVHRFPNELGANESELWYYDNVNLPSVPPFLYLLFFKADPGSPFKLYVPGTHNPTDLLAGNLQRASERDAYQHLREIDPELAYASVSIRPGEGDVSNLGRNSFDAIVVARIEDAPARTVDTSYVTRIEAGKDAIELEYAFSYTPMSFVARAYPHPGSGLMVDYALEILPKDLTLVQYEDKIFTGLTLLGAMLDEKKRQAATIDEQAEIHFKPEELERIRHRPLNFHGRVVAVPGRFDLSVLLKSESTKQFARGEQKLVIEDPAKPPLWMSEPLLCYRVETEAQVVPRQEKAFQFGHMRVYPRVGSAFSPGERPLVYVQLYSAKPARDQLLAHKMRIELVDSTGKSLRSMEEALRGAGIEDNGRVHLAPVVDLASVVPGAYEVLCTLLAPDGAPKAERRTSLRVLAGYGPGVPWLLSRDRPAPQAEAFTVARARGHLSLDQPAAAAALLEGLQRASDPSIGDLLLQSYLRLDQPQKVLDRFEAAVAPVLYSQAKLDFASALRCEGVIEAHLRLGQWQQALLYLERLAQSQEPQADLLFKMARCHRQLGRPLKEQELLQRACALESTAAECAALQQSKSP
jgi:GWxTD domain-containing protein